MSQTETLLLVVLGFALATLIALFIGRFMWTAALKLGARRMQKQVPFSLVGLQTERDRLRAEYAMLSQRLGSRLEAAKIRMAEQMAEVSRHRNRLEKLEATASEREAQIDVLKEQVAELTSQLASAQAASAVLQQNLQERQAEVDHLRLYQSSSGWMGMPSSSPAEFKLPVAANPEDRLRQRIGKLTELAQNVAHDRQHPDLPDVPLPPVVTPPTDPDVIEKLAEAEQVTGDLQRELEKLDQEWARQLGGLKEAEQPAEPASPGPTAVANVISLANRIRDLRKGFGPNS